MSRAALVALLLQPGESEPPFALAIEYGGGQPVPCETPATELPPHAGGLLIAGTGAFGESETVPTVLLQAIDRRFPVLGIGWGMHALNVALGGQRPVRVEGHGGPPRHQNEETVRHPVFIAPGGKVSYTIAGSGWVTVPSAHTHGLMPGQVADGLLASVYAEDQVVEAIEKPGHEWLIGVQWPAHLTGTTPKGFDSLLLALVERSQQ
ncbi:MAG: gamma-glutamyl-gamma-aminobutyrate hydrolase family protein [Chloroflexi bacterium]|nr:gamma-glutamyl-gamma-aminobutyrate hydrolase family protein [Chloroflexota bacterium]MCI0807965.1 gamma-glutamyl-gamma-aminobutyrate hydrolase family protein [Chloroflexota bacterium]MCI0836182.1 gamma-glutamyl-gamma-aminobutyrate hydrolase family protein [Chloroflexota bacterium]MCI0870726.1 gamma-glutamyl-gamma-aminobutyrate hydrolase family protein [Chloroflexota bacterium]MCI0874146.1 gamma-glutamyl-gamma-aminobutyrate hydrolase family protein [Chloroflexota bacterium]